MLISLTKMKAVSKIEEVIRVIGEFFIEKFLEIAKCRWYLKRLKI
ncbi:MAG: hypothetical protein QXQ77_00855 [Candidatus Aenigmatarchaeota archaeon]